MKILKENSNFPGIYVIKNSINGKIYVGKSKNCYKRLHQHLTDIKIDNRNYNENQHLLNAVKKYGEDNFEYYLLEKFSLDNPKLEQLLSEKELYWMKELDSLNPEKGYNLRWDSQGKCFCSKETKEKIGIRAKKDWKNGCHKDHSDKLKEYWKDNVERREQQSKLMSKIKSKYLFTIYSPKGDLITENGTVEDLRKLKLDKSAYSAFSTKKSNDIVTKKYRIIRRNNKDIVQTLEKSEDNLK